MNLSVDVEVVSGLDGHTTNPFGSTETSCRGPSTNPTDECLPTEVDNLSLVLRLVALGYDTR